MKIRLLGIDYGDKRVGLALATTPITEPLTTISREESIETIKVLLNLHTIDALVIGISESEMAAKIRHFASELSQAVKKPIYFQDETLSSQKVAQQLIATHTPKSKRKHPTDHFVAAAILQDFIDEHLPLDELPKVGRMESNR